MSGDGRTVKVLILESEGGNTATAFDMVDGSVEYVGYPYALWTRVKEALRDEFAFDETITADFQWTDTVDRVQNGEYDLVIGHFFRNGDRASKVAFLHPSVLDGVAVVRKPEFMFGRLAKKLLKNALFIVCVGIIAGIVVHVADPERNPERPVRTILTTISAFMGEMGFLAENASLSARGVLATVFCMIVASVVFAVVQTEIVSALLDRKNLYVISYSQAKRMRFLGVRGYYAAKMLDKRLDITIEDPTTSSMIARYDQSDEYDGGCVMALSDAIHYSRAYDIKIFDSMAQQVLLGGWIASLERPDLVQRINEELVRLEEAGVKRHLCMADFPNNASVCLSNNVKT